MIALRFYLEKKSIVSHKATGDTKTLTSYLLMLSPELILRFG